MAKLDRVEHKVFASEAPLKEMGQFGSAVETTLVNTKKINEIQSLPAYTKGWGSAVVSENNYPTMEEMNGVLNVMSYQTGYLYQEGIPVWYEKQEYSASSIVKGSGGQKLYRSLQDNNIGHSLSDTNWWVETFSNSANTDLSNLSSKGQNMANWSSNVTNCITEIPQDIKLELNGGTLTLKAGSKLYKPNGIGNFEEIIIDVDKTGLSWLANTETHIVFYSYKNNGLDAIKPTGAYSGTSFPSTTSNGIRCYRTDENKLYTYRTSTNKWELEDCLPLGIITGSGVKGKISSIDQVFNGFGYIGHTAFILPRVKGLSPDGRNADGSLKNIEQVNPEVRIEQYPDFTGDWCEFMDLTAGDHRNSANSVTYIQDEQPDVSNNSSNYAVWYSPSENIIRRTDNKGVSWEKRNWILYAIASTSSEGITSFSPKQPFHALDYSDFQNTPHIVATYINGSSGYNLYSNGYCEQWGATGAVTATTVTLLKPFRDGLYNVNVIQTANHNGAVDRIPKRNPNSFSIDYDVFAGTPANVKLWRACGYCW